MPKDKLGFMTFKELEEYCAGIEILVPKLEETAKKAVIDSWDKGKDGRKFVENKVNIKTTRLGGLKPIKISVLDNDRGLVIVYGWNIIAIDNWGKTVFNSFKDKKQETKNAKQRKR